MAAKQQIPKITIPKSIFGEVVSTFTVPATSEKFVAKDKFKIRVGKSAKVKISKHGKNFKNWFLEKVEPSFSGSTVYGRTLIKKAYDGPIFLKLGGYEKARTSLIEIYAMMKAQANGESDSLLCNGLINTFYAPDAKGTIRVLLVCWSGGGWYLDALPIKNFNQWNPKCRIFSHNSSIVGDACDIVPL